MHINIVEKLPLKQQMAERCSKLFIFLGEILISTSITERKVKLKKQYCTALYALCARIHSYVRADESKFCQLLQRRCSTGQVDWDLNIKLLDLAGALPYPQIYNYNAISAAMLPARRFL